MDYTTIKLRSNNAPLVHPTELKSGGEHLIGRNNEINANSKQELMRKQGEFVQALQSGKVTPSDQYEMRASLAERRKIIIAALQDQGGRAFQETGAALALELSELASRDGFMRRFLMREDLEQGQIPRIRINFKTTTAVVASSAAQIQPVMVRGKWLQPPEFYIEAYLMIEQRDINQAPTDIMEEKLLEGQEAVMVAEDRVMKKLTDRLIGQSNQLINIIGSFTPQALQALRAQVTNWGLPVANLLFASDVWSDFLTSTGFVSFYDPVSQYELIQTGMLGRILGMNLISDATRAPTLRVLKPGEIYVFSAPQYVGAYTDRGPVVANEINGMANGMGTPSRGWYMMEELSMSVTNNKGVAKAIRQ